MKRSYAFLLLLGLGALTSGCGSNGADYCDQACDCEDCSDREYDECLSDFEYQQDFTSAYDCDAEEADYEDCAIEHNDCDGDRFIIDDTCRGEVDDLLDCIDKGSDLAEIDF
jgi:hypothetical protein